MKARRALAIAMHGPGATMTWSQLARTAITASVRHERLPVSASSDAFVNGVRRVRYDERPRLQPRGQVRKPA